MHVAPHTYLKNLIELDDGFMFTLADRNGSDDDILLARTDVNGMISCGDVADIEVVTTELPELTFDTPTMPLPLSIALNDDASVVRQSFLAEECDIALDLWPDTAICGSLTLYASVPGAHYIWQDGSTNDSLVVVTPGLYWATATVDCCSRTDSITVYNVSEPLNDRFAFVPNVFTPNADGWNDEFTISGIDSDHCEFSVFDRWGERIFHSTDPEMDWDGFYKGRPIPDGTYFYLLQYLHQCDGRVVHSSGHITLLR